MRRLLVAVVLLWSCATHAGAVCRTPCGMTAPEGDCDALKRYEGRVLKRLALVKPFDEARMCNALSGWEIRLHRHDAEADKACGSHSWLLFPGFCAAGYTHLDSNVIEVGDLDWPMSRLAHEMLHVIDADVTKQAGHCRWADPAAVQALDELCFWPDPTKPEADCK